MASELAAARERYRKHLAAKKENDSPYHTSYGKSFLAGTWRDDLIADDEALLARSACEAGEDGARIAELERLNLEAQNRIGDLCTLIGNIEQCRAVEGDSVTILCDNPEAESIETQGAVEVCGDYTGYDLQRFYGKDWEEAIEKAAAVSRRHYSEQDNAND
jgi:hypothetical protein